MNTKYRYKPSAIDAVQFSATPAGIAAIATFGGDDFTGINNQRVNGTPAAAYVAGLVIPEGSWLLRNANGMYKVLKDSVFTAVCEPVPAAASVTLEAMIEDIVRDSNKASPVVEEPQGPAVISRDEARAAGAIRYFTGQPCKHGHMAERYVTNTTCVTCAEGSWKRHDKLMKRRAKARQWYQENASVAARTRKADEALSQSPAWMRPLASASASMMN